LKIRKKAEELFLQSFHSENERFLQVVCLKYYISDAPDSLSMERNPFSAKNQTL